VARAALDPAFRASADLRIVGALVRDPAKPRGIRLSPELLVTTDADALLARAPDVVVEVMGGIEPAFQLVSRALERGIPVVTANKSLLAARGPELAVISAESGTPLLYEASVIAGVPFLGTFARRPVAGTVTRVEGIVNGTSNFLLSAMHATGAEWSAALADAQRRGLAEPDPGNDIEGIDAAEKLAVLLHHLGWGRLRPEAIERTGITGVRSIDVEAARDFGGVLKPVAIAERSSCGTTAFVGPAFVRAASRFSRVDGAENAIAFRNGYGDLFYSGPGAGPEATAATVLDDVFEAAEGNGQRPSPFVTRCHAAVTPAAPVTEWFVRLRSAGRLPLPEEIADLLGSHGVWLRRCSERKALGGCDSLWMLTWAAERPRLERALSALASASACETWAIRVLEGSR
jgi:homoserine dehydrogenase